MKEKDFTRSIMQLLRVRQFGSVAVEVKLARGEALPYRAVMPHQRGALLEAKKGHFSFKIPDYGGRNPFDLFVLEGVKAFVCVVFYKPKELKVAAFIDIEAFIASEASDTRKSLTLKRAQEIGEVWAIK